MRSYTLHHCGVGSNDYIILVHTPRVVALRLKYTYDTHRNRLEADGLADRIDIVAKQFFHNSGTHHYYLGGLLDVLLSKAFALLYRPLLDVEIVYRLAIHRSIGIVVAINGLATGINLGRHLGNKLLFTNDTLVVGHLKCLHARRVLAHTTSHVGTWTNGKQIGSHSREFGTDTLLRTLTDAHHDDDRCHSNDDTQHREERSHLIVCHRLQAYFK